MPATTPTEKLTIGGVPIYVKREDLYTAPIPFGVPPETYTDAIRRPPPFAKMRGLVPYLNSLKSRGVTTVGYMDTAISMAGWGISWYARLLGMKAVIIYPGYKDGYRYNMEAHIAECAKNDAEVFLLEKPTQLSINVYRAKAMLANLYGTGAVLLPQGLPFVQTIIDVSAEVEEVPEAALTGSLVINVGSGTMLAGVLTGLMDLGYFYKPVPIYGIMASSKNPQKLEQKILSKVRSRRFGLGPRLKLIDAGYKYEDAENIDTPFPCNAYYDKKAWKWLMDNLRQVPRPVLFWNIGA